MTLTPSLQNAMQVVKNLEPEERRYEPEERRYLAHVLLDLLYTQGESDGETELLDLAGIAPNLLEGEDAQEWVTRTRGFQH